MMQSFWKPIKVKQSSVKQTYWKSSPSKIPIWIQKNDDKKLGYKKEIAKEVGIPEYMHKRFSKQIRKENTPLSQAEYQTFYHGTSPYAAKKILKEGLKNKGVERNYNISKSDVAYLTSDSSRALAWANAVMKSQKNEVIKAKLTKKEVERLETGMEYDEYLHRDTVPPERVSLMKNPQKKILIRRVKEVNFNLGEYPQTLQKLPAPPEPEPKKNDDKKLGKKVNEIPCRIEIEKNILNVETGKPLTLPLSKLNRSCRFKKLYEKYSGGSIGNVRDITKEYVKAKWRNKAYRQRQMEAYRQRPEVKAYLKVYRQKPEVKAYWKAYYQRPEVKAYKKAYQKAYYQRPEVKAYYQEYRKVYYQRPEVKINNVARVLAWRKNNPEKYKAIRERMLLKAKENRKIQKLEQPTDIEAIEQSIKEEEQMREKQAREERVIKEKVSKEDREKEKETSVEAWKHLDKREKYEVGKRFAKESKVPEYMEDRVAKEIISSFNKQSE